jgi:hypothetical protein
MLSNFVLFHKSGDATNITNKSMSYSKTFDLTSINSINTYNGHKVHFWSLKQTDKSKKNHINCTIIVGYYKYNHTLNILNESLLCIKGWYSDQCFITEESEEQY